MAHFEPIFVMHRRRSTLWAWLCWPKSVRVQLRFQAANGAEVAATATALGFLRTVGQDSDGPAAAVLAAAAAAAGLNAPCCRGGGRRGAPGGEACCQQ